MGTSPSNSFWRGATRLGTRAGHFFILLVFGLMQTFPTPALSASLEIAQSQSYQKFLRYALTHEGAVRGAQSLNYSEADETTVVMVTAYTSTVGETDSDPFTTASGEKVAWGGVAASSWLPMGTHIKMGGQKFTVNDRTNSRYNGQHRVDVWMPNHEDAVTFGVRTLEMEIISSPEDRN